MRYQLHYHAGSGYLVATGAPGADGFEAAARGDIDADGVPSLFAQRGRVDAGAIVMDTHVHVENEHE